MGHFYSGSHRLLDQLVGNQILRFIYLNMVTVDSEHLSASHCHSSEHNSVSLVFWKNNCWWLNVLKKRHERYLSIEAVQVVCISNHEEVFNETACCYYACLAWIGYLVGERWLSIKKQTIQVTSRSVVLCKWVGGSSKSIPLNWFQSWPVLCIQNSYICMCVHFLHPNNPLDVNHEKVAYT